MSLIITEDSLLEEILTDYTIGIAEFFARPALTNLNKRFGKKMISEVLSMRPDELRKVDYVGNGSLAALGRILMSAGIKNKFY